MSRFFFNIILLTPIFLNAQVTIINHSLTDSSLDIAYIDARNIIELKGYTASNVLSFSGTNGTLMDVGNSQYVLRPFEKGECIVSFFDNGKKVASKTYKAQSLPGIVARFSSKHDSINKENNYFIIESENLVNDPLFRITLPDCFYKPQWKVLSYRITLDNLSGNGTITEFTVRGPEPTKEQVQIIKKHGGNTFMTIEEIRVEDPDSRTRKLVPQIFMIR